MCRTLCLSLVVLCSGVGLRADDDRPAQRRDRVNPPSERNADREIRNKDDAVRREDGIREGVRETVQGIVDRSVNRIDSARQFEQQLADCLLIKNQGEINLARFALDHAQNDQVKEFAQMLIKDHEAFGQKLARFAGHAHQILGETGTNQPRVTTETRPATETLPATEQPVANDNPTFSIEGKRGGRVEVHAAKVPGISNAEDWFQLELAAAKKCEQMTKDSLSKNQGSQFDECYLGSQIGMHISVLAQLQASEGFVSGDLHDLLEEGQGTVKKHLDHAEELVQNLSSRTTSEKK